MAVGKQPINLWPVHRLRPTGLFAALDAFVVI
jgi:hypothetical protein